MCAGHLAKFLKIRRSHVDASISHFVARSKQRHKKAHRKQNCLFLFNAPLLLCGLFDLLCESSRTKVRRRILNVHTTKKG
jgi:hypothetical protein